MKVIETALDVLAFMKECKKENLSIGFVPTMGALHAGHLSLVKKAKEENEVTVVSVFVNPTQFNSASDLEKYPRTFESDKNILDKEGIDILFYPSTKEIYPSNEKTEYDLDGLDQFMEGPNRPGHFDGVVQVVTRLFDLVQPTRSYFGEKDFQQLAILKHMSKKLNYSTEIIGCPTLRERNGLAMSSRNVLLSTNAREQAAIIYESLQMLKQNLEERSPHEALKRAIEKLNNTSGLTLEYLEMVNPVSLIPIDRNDALKSDIQACVALQLEGVRLIDNLRVK